jgi:hypothetical protein
MRGADGDIEAEAQPGLAGGRLAICKRFKAGLIPTGA